MSSGLLLIISIICAVTNNILLHNISGNTSQRMLFAFNAGCSFIWIMILSSLCLTQGFSFNSDVLLWGIAEGIIIAAFLFFKLRAFATGPISLTAFIGCSSLIVSTAFGIVAFGERITLIQGIGVVLLVFGLFLISGPNVSKAEKSWKYWCLVFFLCSAASGIFFKLHQKSKSAEYINEMLLIAAITSLIIFSVAAFISKKETHSNSFTKKTVLLILGCGIASCVYNRLNVALSGLLPSVVFFPVFNGSVILISTIFGIVLFCEKLNKKQSIGIILGMLALLMASGTADAVIKNLL